MSEHAKRRIIIVESSAIVREGLTRLLSMHFPDTLIRAYTELQSSEKRLSAAEAVVILNPEAARAAQLKLATAMERFGGASLIGLITQAIDRESLRMFEDVIYLSDTAETIAAIIHKHLNKSPSIKRQGKLSRRETDVLRLLVKGYSNKQIAQELFISVHTVISHRKNITGKLGIRSIAALTVYAVINNLIAVDDYLR